MRVNIYDQLEHRLCQTELIFNLTPLNLVTQKSLRKWNILTPKSNFGKPDNIIGKVIDKTEARGYRLEDLEIQSKLVTVYYIVDLRNFIKPKQKPKYLPAIRNLTLKHLRMLIRRKLINNLTVLF